MHEERGRIKVKYLKEKLLSRNQEDGTERPHCAGGLPTGSGARALKV